MGPTTMPLTRYYKGSYYTHTDVIALHRSREVVYCYCWQVWATPLNDVSQTWFTESQLLECKGVSLHDKGPTGGL
jgi:hypothetical protein